MHNGLSEHNLIKNYYFTRKWVSDWVYQKDPKPRANICTVSRKLVDINLSFKGGSISFQSNKKLRFTIQVYNTAQLILIEPTTPIRFKKHSGSKDDYVTSHCEVVVATTLRGLIFHLEPELQNIFRSG